MCDYFSQHDGGHTHLAPICCNCAVERGQQLGSRMKLLCEGCKLRKLEIVARREEQARDQVPFSTFAQSHFKG